MGTTTNYAFPYPASGDPADIPTDVQALAEGVDTSLLAVTASPLCIVKAVTESVTSSTTLQNDDELLFAVAASEVWVVDMVAIVDGNNTGDVKFNATGPVGATLTAAGIGGNPPETIGAQISSISTYAAALSGTAGNYGTIATGTYVPVSVRWTIINSTTPGSFTVQWAQATSHATATRVVAGSSLTAFRVV